MLHIWWNRGFGIKSEGLDACKDKTLIETRQTHLSLQFCKSLVHPNYKGKHSIPLGLPSSFILYLSMFCDNLSLTFCLQMNTLGENTNHIWRQMCILKPEQIKPEIHFCSFYLSIQFTNPNWTLNCFLTHLNMNSNIQHTKQKNKECFWCYERL